MTISREEKNRLYIQRMTELQRAWGNPIDDDWDFVNEATEEQLDKMLADVTGQLRFEKSTGLFGRMVKFGVLTFITLGIIGLLVFGIRQLF